MIVLVLSKTINCSLLVKQINFTEMKKNIFTAFLAVALLFTIAVM